jgi:hypothetical protein
MLGLFKRTKELAVEFRERCSEVCDKGGRRAAWPERTLLQRYGARI